MHVDGPAGQSSARMAGWKTSRTIPPALVKAIATPPPGEPGPLQTPANDSGFIHAPVDDARGDGRAPSQRAAGRRPVCPSAAGPFAIELSSRRVREAVAAARKVCGRDSRWARCSATASNACSTTPWSTTPAPWIASSRRCAAWRRSSPAPAQTTTSPVETIAANNVVDGLGAPSPLERGARAPSSPKRRKPAWDQRSVGADLDLRHARRRHRRTERRAHRRSGLSTGTRQHVAHGEHAGRDRPGRCAAAGAGSRSARAIRHVAHASPAAVDERPQREHTRLAGRRRPSAGAAERR